MLITKGSALTTRFWNLNRICNLETGNGSNSFCWNIFDEM